MLIMPIGLGVSAAIVLAWYVCRNRQMPALERLIRNICIGCLLLSALAAVSVLCIRISDQPVSGVYPMHAGDIAACVIGVVFFAVILSYIPVRKGSEKDGGGAGTESRNRLP